MSKLGISTGTSLNDGTGDSLVVGATKINSNFTEIYSAIGDGSNINIGIGKTIITTTLSGNVGVGSTIPTSKVDVLGDIKVSGVVTSTTFNGQINSGVSTLGISTAISLNVFGSVTANTFIGNIVGTSATFTDVSIGGTLTYEDVTNVDSIGLITARSGVRIDAGGLLVTSGISTFGGITTVTGNTLFTTQFSSTGISTFENTTESDSTTTGSVQLKGGLGVVKNINVGGTLSVSGVSTFSGITTVTGNTLFSKQLNISGVSTHNDTAVFVPTASGISGIFSGTTSSDMVRITQLGTGNALVVEDSTNPDANPFVVGAAGSVGIGTNDPSALLHLGEGTASANTAPLKFSSGTNLTAVESGTFEYNGSHFYSTPEIVSGRGYIPVLRTYRLTSDGSNIGSALADFYGSTAAINLNDSSVYDLEFHTYFTKNTVGTATWTLTASSAPTLISGYYFANPATGIATGQTNGSITSGYIAGRTVGITSFVPTGSLSTGVNHSFMFKVQVITNLATTFKLQVSQTAGTMTPLVGSYYTIKHISDTTGSFS
jgi:hypothetical protein